MEIGRVFLCINLYRGLFSLLTIHPTPSIHGHSIPQELKKALEPVWNETFKEEDNPIRRHGWGSTASRYPPRRDPVSILYFPKDGKPDPTITDDALSNIIFTMNKLLIDTVELKKASTKKAKEIFHKFNKLKKIFPFLRDPKFKAPRPGGSGGSGGSISGGSESNKNCKSTGCTWGRNYEAILKLLQLVTNAFHFGIYNKTSIDYPVYSLPKHINYQPGVHLDPSLGGGGDGWSGGNVVQGGEWVEQSAGRKIANGAKYSDKDDSRLTIGLRIPEFKEMVD